MPRDITTLRFKRTENCLREGAETDRKTGCAAPLRAKGREAMQSQATIQPALGSNLLLSGAAMWRGI